MSETVTPASAAPAAPSADLTAENAALRGALEKMRVDHAALQSETQIVAKAAIDTKAALGEALRERDTWKSTAEKFEPVAKEADALRAKVQGFVNTGREAAIVEALRSKLTGAEPLAIRGVLSTLHDTGAINKFAEDPAAEAAKALELITKEAPSLTRPAIVAGGSSVVRATPAPPVRRSLVG